MPVGSVAPKAPGSDARTRLNAFVRRSRSLAPDLRSGVAVEPLVKEAGERVYYRIRPADRTHAAASGQGTATIVLCVMAEPYAPGSLPFANSTLLYRELGVRTPRILEEAPELGVIALEDLGDELLQAVAGGGGAHLAVLYDEAVDIIARIQHEGARLAETPAASGFRAFSARLDAGLFLRELQFFAEHFLAGHAGMRLGGPALGEIESLFGALAEEAAGGPAALAHRDFHSRNLIAGDSPVASGARRVLWVIDHQDSRIGPRSYDLMSLVRDPYVAAGGAARLPFREPDLVARFRDAVGIRGSLPELLAEFDAVALQRNLKALGTYGFQVSCRGNDVYRRYVTPTLRMVRENLERHSGRSDRRRLGQLLADVSAG
ncbi:MAG: phosphotransferase [Acidobacteria bacterium]|nr:phosphotransferase [Acidobacteriota bacterium]MXW70696.1 phosphotransferase [Acidobacteriota bacterium]MXX85730.1 phosphotransferase [Acidobacteriota bacterium]MYE43176.1 phosphotransferase [Acidobacteriota bacterium]MYG75802.1 phosphotransferase [Acidobacteriota bacterium]